MTSLLPIQYVTPHSITSTSASSVVELNSTSNTEKQRQQQQQQQRHPHFQQQRWYNNSALTTASLDGSLPSVTVVKPRSTPNATTTASNTRLAYVDALVDVNALVIELIWQLNPAATATSTTTTATATSNKHANKNNVVVPLRTFIQEVLKRSRTTYSTLQTALFYLFRSRPEINNYLTRMQQQQNNNNNWEYAYINCGRRMFLASLVVASKFVQDKTYRNSAWAKIAGLPVSEVNAAERIFLNMIDYRLYISQPKFEQWHHLLHMYVEAKTLNQPTNLHDLSTLPFAATNIDYYDHHDNQTLPSPRTTSPRSQQNYGWTLVLSPTSFLPPPPQHHHHHHQHQHHHPTAAPPLPSSAPPINSNCECQPATRSSKKRKTSSASSSSCSYPPVLSMSLPSSSNSSPMQTPTQISPVRMNNGTSVFNWSSPTSFDHNILHQRSFVNTNTNISNKKRKFASVETHSRSYNLSNVRQQSNRFHS